MFHFTASPAPGDAIAPLRQLISSDIDKTSFQPALRRLKSLSAAFVASCPSPWPTPGLVMTPEINLQSEVWLPLAEVRPVFERLYRQALRYRPILSSTPFADAASWGAIVAGLPEFLPPHSTPFGLLSLLLEDDELREKFIFWSFMPRRFYGAGSDRYPRQTEFIGKWLKEQASLSDGLRCLDAACGDGESSYALAALVTENGCHDCAIEGWTLEPLEVWAAAHRRFPHDPQRQAAYRQATEELFSMGPHFRLRFLQADLLDPPAVAPFDLILCNGLLGGPIIHEMAQMRSIVGNLAGLLRPGGILVAADHFHGGWKKQIPVSQLAGMFGEWGLQVREAGEGICGRAASGGGPW